MQVKHKIYGLKIIQWFFLWLVILFFHEVQGSSFQKIPLEKLVEDSQATAEVELKEKKSFVNATGSIVTEYSFYVKETYGINKESDLEQGFLKVTLLGGSVDGLTSFIDGAPEFSVGEKSFLLLKKIKSKIYISNFTMGKYKIEESEGKIFYVSSVFPLDTDIGRVLKERMVSLVKEKMKIAQKSVEERSDIVVGRYEKESTYPESYQGKRIPAKESLENEGNLSGLWFMWIFFFLLIASGFFIWSKLKQDLRE